MKIESFVDGTLVKSDQIIVQADEAAKELVREAVARASEVLSVDDEDQQVIATRIAGELKGLTKLIETQRESAKSPILSWGRAIDNVAREFANPLEKEYKRITGLLARHIEEVRRKEADERRKAAEAREALILAEKAKLAQLQRDRAAAEADLRRAQDEAARVDAKRRADALRVAQEDEELSQGLDSIEVEEPVPYVPKSVEGGRTVYEYKVKILDYITVLKTNPNLIKMEPRTAEIQALARAQELRDGKIDIPGVEITKTPRVDVRASSSVRSSK